MNVSADTRNFIDFLNGRATCIVVREGSTDGFTSFSFADSKEDCMDLVRRQFTHDAVEVDGAVVAALGKKCADCYLFLPSHYRSTSSQELWEEICRVANEKIKEARKIEIKRKLAALDAERAAFAAQLEG